MKKALELLKKSAQRIFPIILLINFLYSPVLLPVYAEEESILNDNDVEGMNREEVIGLRTENSKTFKITYIDNEYYEVEVDSSKIHYLEGEEYEEVDNNIIYDQEDEYEYKNTANDFTFRAGYKLSEGVSYEKDGDVCKFNLESVSDEVLNESEAKIQGNKIIYPEVYDNADLEFTIINEGLVTEIVAKNESALKEEIKFDISNCERDIFDEAMMNDEDSIGIVKEDIEVIEGEEKLVLEPDYGSLGDIKGEVRIDPSITNSTSYDTFVSPSTRWSGNGRRRAMFIGTYTDYTVEGWPVFRTSRALINFGDLNIPGGALIEDASLQVWHYGTNSGNQAVYVAGITSDWNESTVWPGPNHTGDFGSMQFPYYNSNYTAQIREIYLNTSVVDHLRANNRGLMIRNYNENARGVVICSKNIPSGPCYTGMEPKLIIRYRLNQVPNPPNLDYPSEGWELGANEKYSSINCDKSGKGKGCDVSFRTQTEDPDDSFPLETSVQVRSNEGGNTDFSNTINGEGWFENQRHLNDGHWSWRARTRDSYNDLSNWSVTKNFIVDTTAPSKPNMKSEPEYTSSNQNTVYATVSKDGLIGGVRYNFQISEVSDFSVIKESSGWIEKNEFTFGSLSNGQIYYYRVRSRDKLYNTSQWSNVTSSTQDSVFPEINNIYIDYGKISPANQDGKFDSADFSFEVYDEHISQVSVQLIDFEMNIVREYNDLSETVNFQIDGRDASNDFLPDGVYTVKIVAEDLAGNRTENSESILFIDNNPPFINISSPEDGSWINNSEADISGITDNDALLDILHRETNEFIEASIDIQTGIFEEVLTIINGENNISLFGEDPYGNVNEIDMKIYKEDVVPYINSITPKSVINDRKPEITFNVEDFGYGDFISGIDPDKTYLSLIDSNGKEIVLINEGVNISSLGHIEHDCNGSGKYGLSGSQSCTMKYVFDYELQPDGEYRVKVSIYDKAGNFITHNMHTFTIDSHTYNEVSEPIDGTLFNYSQITLRGVAERYANLEIEGLEDSESITIDPSSTSGRVTVDNCRITDNPGSDGIREICDWTVDGFQLKRNIANDIEVNNTVSFRLLDTADNELEVNHVYKVNLYAVNLAIDTDITYFSPNGDGRQDGIEFVDMSTNGVVDIWQIRIQDESDRFVKVIKGQSSLPSNVYWDGKDEEGNYVSDGDYTYTLFLKTTDGIEFETLPVEIYARVDLSDKVYITYPKDNAVTTRGVVNVQGQAPIDTNVRICVDTVGLSANCDFEYEAEVDENGSFSRVVPLVRLIDQTQTDHIISAVAYDAYGNQTDPSNSVRVVVDVIDPFVSISALPALTGVNNEDDYQVILDKLDNGEEITQDDLNSLRTVILRSTITGNTERVKMSYTELTSLDELPENIDYSYLGYINENDETNLYEEYQDGITAVQSCSEAECTWDFYYPVPPVAGGVYEIEFDGKKGETIQKLTASIMIDGTIPLAPVILDVNKIVEGKSYDTNIFQGKYYSNSERVEIKGAADPDTQIKIEDQFGSELCNTTTDSVGLFFCILDLSYFYHDLDVNAKSLILTTTATDGLNTMKSLEDVNLIIDKIKPDIKSITTSNKWHRSGDYADLSVTTNEKLDFAYLINPENVLHDFSLTKDYKGGISYTSIHGLAPEGKYHLVITVSDMAGNKSTDNFHYFIDNTKPDSVNIDTSSWGNMNGIYASESVPAKGRLVPEYVVRGDKLYISGKAEKNSFIEVFANGSVVSEIFVDGTDCTRLREDKVTSDGVIVKNGEFCNWSYEYSMSEEKGYVFTVKARDRAGNEALVGEDEVVYLDQTKPDKPKVDKAVSDSYEPIIDWQLNGGLSNGNIPITKDINVSMKGYGEALSDYEYWINGPDGGEIDYKYFQNSGYGVHKLDFNLGGSKDSGNCIKDINGKRTGVCRDGIYKFKVKSTDAAGNGSNFLEFSIERDTVAPAKPIVGDPYICGDSICVVVNGESDSYVYVNGGRIEELKSGNQIIKLINNFSYDLLYRFEIKLEDRAKNVSESVIAEIKTPIYPSGDIEGESNENPWGDWSGNNLEDVRFDVKISPDGSYKIENTMIPSPIITTVKTIEENRVEVYGVGIEKFHKLSVNIERQYMTYYEAGKACNVGLVIDKKDRECMQGKMGIKDLSLWIWRAEKECLFFPLCLSQKMRNLREEHKYYYQSFQVQHALVSFYKDVEGNPYIGGLWNDSFNGRFIKAFTLNQDVNAGDFIKASSVIFGEFEFEGIKIDYRGATWDEAQKNRGLGSKFSGSKEVKNYQYLSHFIDASSIVGNAAYRTITQNAFGEYSHVDNAALDIAANPDASIFASQNGYAYYNGDGGVTIKNDNSDYEVLYAHVSNKTKSLYQAGNGRYVKKGDKIAYLGDTGVPGRYHVHYEIYRKDLPQPNDWANRIDCNCTNWNVWRDSFKVYLDILGIPYDNVDRYDQYSGVPLYDSNGDSIWPAKSKCPQI